MKDRIAAFLRAENKTSVQFADEIGVQPSSISHIISGRNNPSLDFVLKMLGKYKYLSKDWLLFGTGKMYNDDNGPKLIDYVDIKSSNEKEDIKYSQSDLFSNILNNKKINDTEIIGKSEEQQVKREEKVSFESEGSSAKIEKIVWFYNDNTFRIFEMK